MAISGPLFTFGIYWVCGKYKINRKVSISLPPALGIYLLIVLLVFSRDFHILWKMEGVLASIGFFIAIFAVTQISLAIIKGLQTVSVMIGFESFAKPDLRELGYFKEAVL